MAGKRSIYRIDHEPDLARDVLSERARAGIKVAAVLARCGRQLDVSQIASRETIAPHIVQSVLNDLRGNGLVNASGRFYGLACSRESISVAQIIRAVDRKMLISFCGAADGGDACDDCQGPACAIKTIARRIDASASAILDNYSLAEAIAK